MRICRCLGQVPRNTGRFTCDREYLLSAMLVRRCRRNHGARPALAWSVLTRARIPCDHAGCCHSPSRRRVGRRVLRRSSRASVQPDPSPDYARLTHQPRADVVPSAPRWYRQKREKAQGANQVRDVRRGILHISRRVVLLASLLSRCVQRAMQQRRESRRDRWRHEISRGPILRPVEGRKRLP